MHAPSMGAKQLRSVVTEAVGKEIANGSLDLSGIHWMEHINLVVGDTTLAEYFYLTFLGFTRDASKLFHVNLGQQQFHLAETGDPPQRIAGSIGLTIPNLATLAERIPDAKETLRGTQFEILKHEDDYMEVRGPWGNLFCIYDVLGDSKLVPSPPPATPRKMENCHAMGGGFGSHRMAVRGQPGLRFIEISCSAGKSKAIGRFYKEVMKCQDVLEFECDGSIGVTVSAGPGVTLVFCEQQQKQDEEDSSAWEDAMKGVHICIYIDDFEGTYNRLSERQLIWTNPRFTSLDTCDTWEEAKASRTLRFKDITDDENVFIELEHETRPLRHGQYMKAQQYVPR